MRCPQCGNILNKVRQDASGILNSYQFDATKAGDYYCEHCPPNGRSCSNRYCYFWEKEVE